MLFASLSNARPMLSSWRDGYNHMRQQSGIEGLTPANAARWLVQSRPQGHHDNLGLQLLLEEKWGARLVAPPYPI
ncbi:MAG: hypothetical protein J0J06_13730 [Sphingomonas sp.]|nr:hypothetical protein [Sphingomonas sp.]